MTTRDNETPIRTITMRILRDGPTHNHLLSPLTPYLAEVGPYEVATVHMPYEHRRLLRDLDTLTYGRTQVRGPDPSRTRSADRRIIADEIGQIFAAIPGLTAEMSVEPACDSSLTHLNLVFAASELSLLPFELATAPRGFPGEGMPLSVQSIAPVVITRSIPSAMGKRCRWGEAPRILFAAAQPPGFREVPVQAHLQALLGALEPWIGPFTSPLAVDGSFKKHLDDFLTFRPRATFEQIKQDCKDTRFTHVHILAHSEIIDRGSGTQFALALHDKGSGKDLVDAERLQAALRLPMQRHHDDGALSHPLVVSLATCDSGNQGQVVFPSMSLAHALHAAGVPLVVGSLFPLTYPGSAKMAETLYRGLLRGRDPRRVLYDVRHDLFLQSESTHDWASLVAYASLPDDSELTGQVRAAAFRAAMARVRAWNQVRMDLSSSSTEQPANGQTPISNETIAERFIELDDELGKAVSSIPVTGDYCLEGRGMRASTEKRRAEVLWDAAQKTASEPDCKALVRRSRERLTSARVLYEKAAHAPRWVVGPPDGALPTVHWVLTQGLSLDLVLDGEVDPAAWWAAQFDAQSFLRPADDRALAQPATDREDQMWAHASLAELYLIAHGAGGSASRTPEGDAPALPNDDLIAKAESAIRAHVRLARTLNPTASNQTRDQLERYRKWWFDESFVESPERRPLVRERVQDLVERLLELFPPEPAPSS